jgi:hypothetical protein
MLSSWASTDILIKSRNVGNVGVRSTSAAPISLRVSAYVPLSSEGAGKPSLAFPHGSSLLPSAKKTSLHAPDMMMYAEPLPHRKERRVLAVVQQHLHTLHPTCRLASRARNACQLCDLLVAHRQLDHLPPSCHDATPRSINHKRGIGSGHAYPEPSTKPFLVIAQRVSLEFEQNVPYEIQGR